MYLKKNLVSKVISYVFYCFLNFLMYSFVFSYVLNLIYLFPDFSPLNWAAAAKFGTHIVWDVIYNLPTLFGDYE